MRRLLLLIVVLLPLGCAERSAPPRNGDEKKPDDKPPAPNKQEKPSSPSLAVLPFKAPSLVGFDVPVIVRHCNSMADTLHATTLQGLSNNPKLDVRAQAVVRDFRDTDAVKAGKSLHVTHVLTGEVKNLRLDEIVVTLELFEAETGRQLWIKLFRHDYRDADNAALVKFEETIGKEVATAVAEKLGAKQEPGPAK